MESNFTYPPLWKRLVATIIDLYFVFMVAYLLTSILPAGTNVAIVGFALLYDPICTSFACTFGAFLFKFRVRQIENPNQKINFFKAIIRYITKLFLGVISFLTIHSNDEKRAIHDLVSGSIVVNK